MKNGKLLTECINNNIDVVLAIDKNLMFQQNLGNYPVTIVVLNALTSKIEEGVLFMPSSEAQSAVLKSAGHTSSTNNAFA